MLHFLIGLGILALILSLRAGRWLVGAILVLGAVLLFLMSRPPQPASSSSGTRGASQADWERYFNTPGDDPVITPGQPTQAPAAPPPAAVINLADLKFRDLAAGLNGSLAQLTGTVTNTSPYPVDEMTFRITVEDCTTGAQCTTVGVQNASARIAENYLTGWKLEMLSIPPGQMRQIASSAVWFAGLPSLAGGSYRKLSWTLTAAHPPSGTAAKSGAQTTAAGFQPPSGSIIVASKPNTSTSPQTTAAPDKVVRDQERDAVCQAEQRIWGDAANMPVCRGWTPR